MQTVYPGGVDASYDANTGLLTLPVGHVTTSHLEEYIFAQDGTGAADSGVVLIFTGTPGPEELWSYFYRLDASMLGGDDKVVGSYFDDVVDGGDGNDFVDGVGGSDTCTHVEIGPC